MATFAYTARNNAGQIIKGTVSANDRDGATKTITSQGLKPILLKSEEKAKGFNTNLSFGGHVKTRDMVIFTRQLATMVNAGVPMVRSLATLQAQTQNKFFKEKLGEIAKKVESGVSLGDSLADHPDIFSPIYINMVRAGEEGGILDEALNRLALQTEKDAAIRAKVKSALAYPMVISIIMVVAFYALMKFIVPKLGTVISNMGAPLPTLTKVMLKIGTILPAPGPLVLMIIGLVVALFVFRKPVKRWRLKHAYLIARIILKIPVVKELVIKVSIARFARIFSSLMAAGVTVLTSIETTSNAIGNKVIEHELMEASKQVRNGAQLSSALSESKIFPPIVSQMLAVGEETGQIDKILVKVAEFYEEEVDAFVAALSSIIEPLVIIVLGGLVGLVAASVFGPLSSLTQSIK